MGTARLISTFALLISVAACASRPTPATQPQQSIAPAASPVTDEVPLLYVVDGVTQPPDRIPRVHPDQVESVRVIKGRAALLKYGPAASYGVVIIKTKRVAAHTT